MEKIENSISLYFTQLQAMLKRNLLLKRREKRKTTAEVLLPLYSLGILILMKILIPNPNFPVIDKPRGEAKLFEHFHYLTELEIAVVPNTTHVRDFLVHNVNEVWKSTTNGRGTDLSWTYFATREDLLTAYWLDPKSIPLAIIFDAPNPLNESFRYEIRTNPSYFETPPTTELYSYPSLCRESSGHWSAVLSIENREICPINEYYYSGFVALQALLDYAKIRNDTGRRDMRVPHLLLEMFPKEAFTGNWMVAFRVVIPLYMVMALSQFVAYLLILIVGEKENKIKEGMKIMGLKDSVFWLSWFIIYGAFVLFLSTVCCILVFALRVFQNTNLCLIFLLVLLYSLSIIMFGFMITPFFDKSRTAGILGNFSINILSLFYFLQIFVDSSSSTIFWIISLISSTGFALAMDKALVMDLHGEGVNFNNLWSGPGMPFGGSLIMMGLDIVLYGCLAFYLDSVIPSEHGTKRSPLFCFKLSYWCRKRTIHVPLANGNSAGSFNNGSSEEGNSDIEQVPREMKGREAIKIVDLYKSFQHCRKAEVKAVNGINLTIYEGQITAILGHNGAGKTTLFNILTGLTAPSSGTAYIFGYDIRDADDMDQIRRMTGVCPQHDILFDNLTPREHLEFFAAVKGISSSVRDFEVTKVLKDIDLTEKANCYAKHLSGGQKRKLSIGIAVIGDPKIIILDEPTAGVDPYSRRHMWSVLQNLRYGKVILLTTHFMDEADILADRKAVVSKGRLRCCGSSLFLKNKFGIGYHLTLVLDGISREHAITKLVTSHVQKAEKARRHGRELSFILPHNAVNNFASLFSAIEQEINNGGKLGISSYGVSMTTLEEVFLHLEKDEEVEGSVENLSKKMVRSRALSRSLSLQSKSTSYQSLQNENSTTHTDGRGDTQLHGLEVICETKSPIVGLGLEKIETKPNVPQTFIALLRLRVLRLIRDIQKLYFMILLPLGLAAIGLYLNSIQSTERRSNVLDLNSETYGNQTNFLIHNATNGEHLESFMGALKEISSKRVRLYNGNFSFLLKVAPHMAALNINTLDVPRSNITVIYNDTLQHSLPIIINAIDNVIYRLLMENKSLTEWQPIELRVYPFQQTSQPEEFNIGVFSTSLFLGMVFVLVPVSLAVDMVYDREIKAKNQLRVNGLSFSIYFTTYFVVLAALMLLISAALLLIILVFDIPSLRGWPALNALGILLLLHCPASILFTTCISYIFDKTDSALSILPNIATLFGMVPFFLVFGLDMFRIGGKAAYVLHIFFSLVNTMYIPYGAVYYVQRVYLMCTIYGGCATLNLVDYMTQEIVVMIVGIVLHFPIWFFILMVIDIVKTGGKVSDVFKLFRADNELKAEDLSEFSDIGENEDDDVKAERQKVKDLISNPAQNPPVVIVQNLHKEYRKRRSKLCESYCKKDEESRNKVAVKSLSLAIDAGEVFGLLGHNGAGKTTTMKIITAEEAPTRGRVQIGGKNITCSLDNTFQLLGYCPQHDALWKNITVKEHLECYAAIRGVPSKDIQRVVDLYLSGLQIEEHASKQAQHCSGGTRRKLSFAMAMVGNPKVVLLDEPSTGMDPRSKRFLWDTILASFQGAKGAILTTHSMEEADALCSRVGIMVKGELRCLGSTQHLKNLYGAGYTLEMKLRGGDRTPTTTSVDRLKELKEFVRGLFPEASLKESFADRLVFSVPQKSVPSLASCFSELEKAKTELDIEEYSFSQTTLEQVFLKFAQYDEINNSEDDVLLS